MLMLVLVLMLLLILFLLFLANGKCVEKDTMRNGVRCEIGIFFKITFDAPSLSLSLSFSLDLLLLVSPFFQLWLLSSSLLNMPGSKPTGPDPPDMPGNDAELSDP